MQSRKIEFIQEFLKIQNEEIITHFESMLNSYRLSGPDKPMSVQEFNNRIDQSLTDSSKENVTEADDLISEIERWH